MADKKITQLTNITGVNLVDADEFVVVDISADETKAVTLGELKEAFDSGSGFVRITGDTMTGDLGFGDNDKAIFGAGSDLQIYHNGTDSLIADTGSGTLKIYGDTEVAIQDPANGEYMAKFIRDGAVELYHNNALKIATSATGIDVTGTVTADDILLNTGGKFRSSIDTSSVALSGGTNSNVGANIVAYGSTHSSAANDLIIRRSGTKFALFDGATGDINFYATDGTTQAFHWDAADESLGIGNTSFTNKLNVTGAMPSSGTPLVQLSENSGGARDGLYLDYTGTTNSAVYSLKIADATKTHLAVRGDGKVGFGTSSPSATIEAVGNLDVIKLKGTSGNAFARFTDNDASSDFSIGADDGSGAGAGAFVIYDRNATAYRMTLDASGRLLVGKTSSNYATEGVEIRDNEVLITKAGANPLSLRNNGTGGLISFNSAGVSVGGIGASGGSSDELYIYATAGKGILLNNNGLLAGTSSGGGSDNTTDLGQSDVRFKDLYLSGGVYLGGTGAANKLDDVEEGDWTPGTSSGTISFANAKYTKIGRSVTVSALIYNISDRSSSNVFTITNLPFSSCASCKQVGSIMMRYQSNTSLTAAYITQNSTNIEFYGVHAGGWDVALHSDWNNINSEVYFTITYNAD